MIGYLDIRTQMSAVPSEICLHTRLNQLSIGPKDEYVL